MREEICVGGSCPDCGAVAGYDHAEFCEVAKRGRPLPVRVLEMCKARGWSLHWTARGAYLHLEASELIEAIRGKRSDPISEAADVLLVLMSITENAGIDWSTVVATAEKTVDRLMTSPRYKGEEFATREP